MTAPTHPTHRMNWPLLLILALFLVGAWVQGRVLPILEGGDEWLQLAYVEHLRSTGTLPDRTASQASPIRQQSGQPPLTYAVTAAAVALRGVPPIDSAAMYDDLQADSNNWFTPPDRFNRTDNNNVFYLENRTAQNPAVVAAVRAGRWVAPMWGLLAIVAAYGAAWEVFRQRGWALTAAAVFAFTPTFVHVNSFITTDGGAAALGTLTLWLALMTARRGLDWRRSLMTGLVIGLAGLAKVSAVLVAPAAALAVILAAWGTAGRWRRIVTHGALMAAPFALSFGVWVLWGALSYGDPFGTGTHRFPGQVIDPPLGAAEVLARLPEVYLSYWGKFASAVYLHPATYGVLSGLVVVAVLGWGVRAPSPPGPLSHKGRGGYAVVLVFAFVTMFGGVVYWVATINFITGRLLFPAAAAVAISLTAGFERLARRAPSLSVLLRVVLVVPVAVTGLVITPAIIGAAYRPPVDARADLPPLQAAPHTFEDVIALVGWRTDDLTLSSGTLKTVTLCWEVLAEPQRPAAYSLKIVLDGVPIGERTTVHGLGRYASHQWEPGRVFCDAVDVPIGDVNAGTAYDVLLVMLDAQTGAVDWEAVPPDGAPMPFALLGQLNGAAE